MCQQLGMPVWAVTTWTWMYACLSWFFFCNFVITSCWIFVCVWSDKCVQPLTGQEKTSLGRTDAREVGFARFELRPWQWWSF
jgi:hypothetical protein